MCETGQTGDNGTEAAITPVAPVEQIVADLSQAVEAIRRELDELRMDRRKVMLEELARLEEPLVERGVIAQRTRPPRHKPD